MVADGATNENLKDRHFKKIEKQTKSYRENKETICYLIKEMMA